MSGLSEMMQREAAQDRDSKFHDYETLAPAKDPRPRPIKITPDSVPAPKAPPKEKKAGAARSGYLLLAACAVALALLGGGIWFTTWYPQYQQAPVELPEPLPEPEPVYEGPTYQDLPLTPSQALAHNPWQRPNRPYQATAHTDALISIAGDGLTASQAGGIDYIGRVVTEHPGVIVDAELTVSLVDRQGLERARTTLPVAMVSQDQPMLIRVPIPADLDPRALDAFWSIQVNEALAPAIPIELVEIEQHGQGADTMTRILIENDTGETIEQAVLVITAWSSTDEPLRRWKTHWQMPIKPGKLIEFYTRTAVTPSWRIDRWSVAAAGE